MYDFTIERGVFARVVALNIFPGDIRTNAVDLWINGQGVAGVVLVRERNDVSFFQRNGFFCFHFELGSIWPNYKVVNI